MGADRSQAEVAAEQEAEFQGLDQVQIDVKVWCVAAGGRMAGWGYALTEKNVPIACGHPGVACVSWPSQ